MALAAGALMALGLPVSHGVASSFIAPPAIEAALADLPAEFSAQSRTRRLATRIEVYPNIKRVRRCIDWYAIERRPSGEVITPHMRCWWAAR
jgi:hypothetical protein